MTEVRPANTSHATGRKALILGASGATGRYIVRDMLERDAWEEVISVGRKDYVPSKYGFKSPTTKLKNVVVKDLEAALDTEEVRVLFEGVDTLFISLGAAIENTKMTGPTEQYIPEKAYKIAAKAGVQHLSIISCEGEFEPDKGMQYYRHLYHKEKSATESGINNVTIMKPAMLDRQTCSLRMATMFRGIGLKVEKIARAMVIDAEKVNLENKTDTVFYSVKQIKEAAA